MNKIMKVLFTSCILALNSLAFINASSDPANDPKHIKKFEFTFAEFKCESDLDLQIRSNKKVLFHSKANNTNYFFKRDGLLLQLKNLTDKNKSKKNNPINYHQLNILWDGMNKDADIHGADELAYAVNPMELDIEKDCIIKKFRKLYYLEIYPGIDLRYYDGENELKYDLRVQPGFNYNEIKLNIQNADRIYINDLGQVVIKISNNEVIQDQPLVLQDGKPLLAKWILNSGTLNLEIKNPDTTKELFIQLGLRS